MNRIEIDTHLFEKWNKQNKLGRFRQNITEKVDTKNISRNYDLVYYHTKVNNL